MAHRAPPVGMAALGAADLLGGPTGMQGQYGMPTLLNEEEGFERCVDKVNINVKLIWGSTQENRTRMEVGIKQWGSDELGWRLRRRWGG
eukprot:scaffold14812_cov21-Tisochrysis_lutea.AAC.4